MAFDFPDAPTIGDVHVEAGVEYVFAGGGVWNLAGGGDLTEYVLKAGDTMTGGLRVKPDGVGGVRMSPGDAGRAGMFEFYDAADVRMGYIGWGNTEFIRLYTEPGKKWDVQGRGFMMNEGAGIHWGSTGAQTDPLNFSEGICLYGYGGTSQFGWTITSGTLNHVVQNNGNKHAFRVGPDDATNTRVIIDSNGIGPRTSYNVAWLNGFSGTMDFRVNPSMVTMRVSGLKRNVASGANTSTKICAYPAGVAAPWATPLSVLVRTRHASGYGDRGDFGFIEARADGVYLLMWGGGSGMDAADDRVDGVLTWSR